MHMAHLGPTRGSHVSPRVREGDSSQLPLEKGLNVIIQASRHQHDLQLFDAQVICV